jgi:hypothetical protein
VHGIPAGADFSPLLNKSLEQVCIGLHEAIFRFEDEMLLSISCSFELTVGDQSWRGKEYVAAATAFSHLLGVAINNVKIMSSKQLCLEFGNGAVLVINDSEDHYESFHVQMADKFVAV